MRKSIVFLAAAGILAGCASGGSTSSSASGPPVLQSGPDAEVTVDGLYRVDNSIVELAFMRPDIDLRGYTAIMIDDVEVSYQMDPRGRRTRTSVGDPNANFALTETQMANFKRFFHEAVVEALSGDGGLRVVDTRGPDVLRLTAELMDLIIRVPTQQSGNVNRQLARSYGEVTLVLEARDSQSGSILARAADRQDPTGNPNQDFVAVRPDLVRTQVRRLFEYWAGLLRRALDRAHGR